MKMKHILIPALTAFVFFSCQGETTEETDTTTTEEQEEVVVEMNDPDLEGLKLNNGAKWKVDTSTYEGMNQIAGILDAFDGEDHKQLGKDIKAELKEIMNNCSMKGEDHNQYHIVLKAMLSESKALKKGNSDDASKMQHYIDAYNAHFEL